MKESKLTKTEQEFIKELELFDFDEYVSNRSTGDRFLLKPLGVALFDFIKGSEMLIANGNYKLVGKFDLARDIFRKLYPDEYMGLLD